MTFDTVKEIVDQLPKGSVVTFTGGEPTIAKDFLKIIEYTARNHKVQINTNGATLNKEKVTKLIDFGIWIINFSVDSHKKEVHDQIRGHNGLSQIIFDSIEQIRQIKKEKGLARPYIHINTVVLKEAITYLPEIVKLCIRLKIDWLSFAPNRDGRGIYDYCESDLLILKDKLRESMKLANAAHLPLILGEELKSVNSILKFSSPSTVEAGFKREMDMSPFACYAPWSTLWIRPDGTARICRAVLGNIKNDRIKDLWNNETARNLRKTFYFGEQELPEKCQGCCIISRSSRGK